MKTHNSSPLNGKGMTLKGCRRGRAAKKPPRCRLPGTHLGGGDGGDVLLRQLLEYGGLTGVVKAKDEDASLALGLLELAEERKKTHRYVCSAGYVVNVRGYRNLLSFEPRDGGG
mmetsp:Transcript_4480/g.14607  ORF Transcript_4480/g.14607 Transcript_4480/m.14607 type:complete len:114 (+) Transcript_4480:963-1304(+)